MSESNKCYAFFSLTGEFDPEEITRRLGVKPSDTWRKGDWHPRVQRERKNSRWKLESRLTRLQPLEDHIADVLAQMEKNAQAFSAISKEYNGLMQLVGYFHEGYPGLGFDAQLVAGLAKFNLSMDLDFYALWSDAREDT
ncbi:DUF4279 domain-containing protein [Lampropedia aestuarii]|uniref:DUF4279 domain-containing protein n=1 Tax=Lampropedia aestuarii TaxID=2562762 RepID=UPI002468699F|nr:DUF4279 domain-containing protein [Lampropedia aestuarii]MDH5858166.1 DUF4279 domain-containing protein [Lampropedia aestuarii]